MKRTITGKVTSDKDDKTIVVTVTSRKTHPLYKKQYSFNTKFMAHDEKNQAKVGDIVTITGSRPLSKRKRFMLNSIVEKATVGFVETDATAGLPPEESAGAEQKAESRKQKAEKRVAIAEKKKAATKEKEK